MKQLKASKRKALKYWDRCSRCARWQLAGDPAREAKALTRNMADRIARFAPKVELHHPGECRDSNWTEIKH